jgi:ribose/xylose/arabinose/galactoside ABC-type transport system permease subunit
MTTAAIRYRLRRQAPQIGMIAAFLAIVIVFSALSPVFLTYGNFINIANQTAIISVLAFGMTLVMLSGGIDLSVGSLVSLSAVVCALILDTGAPTALAIARGLSLVLSDGRTIYIESEFFLKLTAQGTIGKVPMLFVWTLVIFALTWVLLNMTTFGRKIRAVGGNAEAARQAGISPGWVSVRVFMISGGLAAFAGLMMAGRLSSGLPSVGVGMELDAIAAAVLGGTGFKGEGGSLVGTLFGALVLGTVINGLTVLGVNPYLQEVAKGLIIILAVVAVSLRRRPW